MIKIKVLDWVLDIATGICFIVFLYAAYHSQACVMVYDYKLGVCPNFYEDK